MRKGEYYFIRDDLSFPQGASLQLGFCHCCHGVPGGRRTPWGSGVQTQVIAAILAARARGRQPLPICAKDSVRHHRFARRDAVSFDIKAVSLARLSSLSYWVVASLRV